MTERIAMFESFVTINDVGNQFEVIIDRQYTDNEYVLYADKDPLYEHLVEDGVIEP